MTYKTMLALGGAVVAAATVAHVLYWETRPAEKRVQDPVRKVVAWLKNK